MDSFGILMNVTILLYNEWTKLWGIVNGDILMVNACDEERKARVSVCS